MGQEDEGWAIGSAGASALGGVAGLAMLMKKTLQATRQL